MQKLTPTGQNIINGIANRYQLSNDAVIHMLVAVNNGSGTMAQFNCPELGGGGQWMQGGMTMVGDMFNNGLKATVDNLCSELANALAQNEMFPTIPAGTPGSNQWWPSDLGAPFSSGGQNNTRYAVFPNRLAVEEHGNVIVYDTLDHQIGGVSQQQGGNDSLSFSSQYGTISVNSLPVISGVTPTYSLTDNAINTPTNNTQYDAIPETPSNVIPEVPSDSIPSAPSNAIPSSAPSNDAIQLLEQLGRLRDAGVLTTEEFNNKKHELLARI